MSQVYAFPPTPSTVRKQRERRAQSLATVRKLVAEIYETEQTYVDSLRTLCEEFAYPLSAGSGSSTGKILTPGQHTALFSNVYQILQLNTKLLEDLESVAVSAGASEEQASIDERLSTIGRIFNDFTPFLKMYIGYVTNFGSKAQKVLQELQRNNTKWRKFCASRLKISRCKGLDINSYLIMPIQRIPRYRMLLAELLKHLERISVKHGDSIDELRDALEKIKQVATHINAWVKRKENMNKVLEIANVVEGSDPRLRSLVQPTRTFVKQGQLLRCTRRGTLKSFYVWLFNDMLLYGTPLTLKSGKYRVHKVIQLHGCVVGKLKMAPEAAEKYSETKSGANVKAPVEQGTAEDAGLVDGVDMHSVDPKALMHFAFTVQSPQKSFIMIANSVSDCDAWIGAIRGAATVLMADEIDIGNGRRSFQIRKGTSGYEQPVSGRIAPMWQPDSATKKCTLCTRKFGLLRRRHHCRSCGRVVCDVCSGSRHILLHINRRKPQRVCDRCVKESNFGGVSHDMESVVATSQGGGGKLNGGPTEATEKKVLARGRVQRMHRRSISCQDMKSLQISRNDSGGSVSSAGPMLMHQSPHRRSTSGLRARSLSRAYRSMPRVINGASPMSSRRFKNSQTQRNPSLSIPTNKSDFQRKSSSRNLSISTDDTEASLNDDYDRKRLIDSPVEGGSPLQESIPGSEQQSFLADEEEFTSTNQDKLTNNRGGLEGIDAHTVESDGGSESSSKPKRRIDPELQRQRENRLARARAAAAAAEAEQEEQKREQERYTKMIGRGERSTPRSLPMPVSNASKYPSTAKPMKRAKTPRTNLTKTMSGVDLLRQALSFNA